MGSPFQPSQFKALLTTLRQPASIAAILSLGIHGVLFGAAPSFSSLSSMATLGSDGVQGTAEQRRVPLVELTPEEQKRLPDFSSSAYSLTPGAGSGLGLLPVPGSKTPLSTPLSISPGPFRNNEPSTPMPSNPFAIGMAPYIPPSIAFPEPRTSLPRVVRPPSGSTVQRPETPAKPNPANPNGSASGASTPTAQTAPGTRTPSAADLLPERPSTRNGQSGSTASGPVASSGSSSSRNGAGREPGAAGGERTRLQAQLQALAYNPDGTTGDEAATARQSWLAEVEDKTKQPNLQVADPIEVSIPYQGRVCLSPSPVNGLVGAWATADGKLGDDPVVLRSTGYPLLNQQAEAAIAAAAANFPKTDAPTAYEFEIKINYDAKSCIPREQLLRPNNAG